MSTTDTLATIPADRWHDNGDGTAWMVPLRCPDERAPQGAHWGQGDPCVHGLRLLDRPCDTCEGDYEGEPTFHDPLMDPCPDCIDGRHTFTIKVETEHPNQCARCGRLRLAWNSECHCGYTIDGVPAVGFREHRVSVVPGMVLPIVEIDNGERLIHGIWAVLLALP